MKVLKFGGSSIGSAEKILQVNKIIESQQESCIVVVSALINVTDQLIAITTMAMKRNELYKTEVKSLEKRHLEIVKNLIKSDDQTSIIGKIKSLFNELEDILNGIFLLGESSPKIQDLVLSFGERTSAYIISKIFTKGKLYDARKFIRTNSNFGSAKVDFDLSEALIREEFKVLDHVPVIPGFIGSDENNETTTLGRGGSDYTAALIASALNASILEIWTDVDGFMSADPRKVPKAYAIDSLTYAEAIELSHFGAKVVYTPTIHPVYKKNIPIVVKNTFNPSAKGTIISSDVSDTDSKLLIKGVSSIDDISLITVQGAGMVGVTGTSMRVFRALGKSKTNAILITQASSEFSICIAVIPQDAKKAKSAIEEEFQTEINLRNEIKVIVEDNLSVIAIVGERMRNTPGISANLFKSLYHNGINVIASAQGSSELNISVVIKRENLAKALNSIHEGFFLSQYKELNVFLVGTGVVGGALLKQIHQQQPVLLKEKRLKIKVVGIANIDHMLFEAEGIGLENWNKTIEKKGEPINLDTFVSKIKELNLRNSVFIDCTAAPAPASHYLELLDSYVSVVTPNKIAASSEYKNYRQLKDTAQTRGVKYLFETNVGAGLPVINTISDLVMSGDKILKIEAVLSGTLNFIFNVISADVPLSKTIRLAKEKGYSEPDPRIDLSGTDVVRKILILARESGYPLEKNQINVETFLPKDCFEGTIDEFWTKVEKFDKDFELRRQELEKQGKRWRFVARFDEGKVTVKLIEVDFNHPAYVLEGSNNIIILTTERYKELPMVIKGYGAGADVTAAGIFADVIRVANL
jgi:bifunctional aspartokinase / homoserine dehydrogenase 1